MEVGDDDEDLWHVSAKKPKRRREAGRDSDDASKPMPAKEHTSRKKAVFVRASEMTRTPSIASCFARNVQAPNAQKVRVHEL